MRYRYRIALGLFVILFASSWGFLVHRSSTQLAIYQLPDKMRPFFHQHMESLVFNSVRPDQRRNDDKTEAPKHYIDLEPFGDSAAWKMPMNWSSAVSRYSKDTLEKYGYVPYWVLTMKERLTNAFRSGNRDSILFHAADLAHYVQDANVPLHTSINHDGQLTGQKGMHSLWESMIPEIEITGYNLASRHKATYLHHPDLAIWTAVRRAHALLPQMFHEEKEASKAFTDSTKYRVQIRNGRESRSYTSAFAKAYAARLGNTINQQLLASTDLLSDFWYTAWVDAGQPDLSKMLKAPNKGDRKKALKKEAKAYRKNELLKKGWLIAKKEVAEG